MAEPIKWLYFDTKQLVYIDDDNIISYLQANPDSIILEVQVDENSQLPSGIGLTADYPALARKDDIVYEIVVSGGNNLNISVSGSTVMDGFLPFSGGTMIGDLILDHDPVVNLEAATKQYVDQEVAGVSGGSGDFLPLSGGTMTGDLILYNDPVIDLHAATKQYVDNTISGSSISGSVADAISSLIQVDLEDGVDLTVTNNKLPFSGVTAIIQGEDYDLYSDEIGIKDPGLYQVSWNVVGTIVGNPIRRRNLVADLNRNNGAEFVKASIGGSYTRDEGTSPLINVGGDYVVRTISENETIALRSRDLSVETTTGITFTVYAGYFRIRLVRKD